MKKVLGVLCLLLLWAQPALAQSTLGYTTIGTAGSTAQGGCSAAKVTPTEDGTITKITVYIGNYYGGGHNFRTAIYADSSGTPNGGAAATSGSATAVTAGSTAYDSSISYSITNGTPIWLVVLGDNGNAETVYDAGSSHQNSQMVCTYPTWPTWSELFGLDRAYTIYATYTPAGGGASKKLMLTGVGNAQ